MKMREVYKNRECRSCKAINNVRTVCRNFWEIVYYTDENKFNWTCAACGYDGSLNNARSIELPTAKLASDMTESEIQRQNQQRLTDAYKKIEFDGWVYFIDDEKNYGLFRARTDSSGLTQITERNCDGFEIKDGMLYVSEEFIEYEGDGWVTNRCSGKIIYEINGDELTQKERKQWVHHSEVAR